jgi:hypothetical protein
MDIINSLKFGFQAYDQSRIKQTGRVIGITSRGIFLRTERERIIFLTTEEFGNPLNVSIEVFPGKIAEIALNDSVIFGNAKIQFPARKIAISLPEENVYLSTPPPLVRLKSSMITEQIKKIADELAMEVPPIGFSSVLPAILENDVGEKNSSPALNKIYRIRSAFRKCDLQGLTEALATFLGEGRGLTPSGDDLICGFLLSINRWNPFQIDRVFLKELNQKLVQAAHRKTTTLSVNLIELAAAGDGDERLLVPLDSIFTGHPSPKKSAALLRAYGSSSGIDAFTGMVLTAKKDEH